MPAPVEGSLPPAQVSAGPLLGVDREDIALGGRPRGPLWRTLLLPLQDVPLGEDSFLLGYLREFGGDFAKAPLPGQCVRTEAVQADQSKTRRADAILQRTFQLSRWAADGTATPAAFASSFLTPSQLLFVVLEEETGALLALGRFAENGTASCALPRVRLAVSTGFGQARSETSVPEGATETTLAPVERGRLRIDPSALADRISLEGTLLRIGRETRALQGNSQTANLRLPLPLDGDLFKSIPNPSENFGAKEIFQSTILIGSSSFSLNLEPGDYVATLSRPGGALVCVARIAIRNDAQSLLTCPRPENSAESGQSNVFFGNPSSAQGFSADTAEALVDATFFPPRLLASDQFRQWMTAAGLTHALLPDKPTDLNTASRTPSRLDYVFAPLPGPLADLGPSGPYSGWFGTIESFTEVLRSQEARVLLAPELLEGERKISTFLQNTDHTILPLGGMGEEGLGGRTTPFLLTTRFRFPRSQGFVPDASEILVSNGIDIEWTEPSLSEGAFPLRMPLQQRFRARVRIPPGYRPDYAELYVNSNLFKRWYIAREEVDSWETFLIDERIDLSEDFFIALSVWGQTFLPELTFGSSTTPALAFTRSYCIDANENGICEAMR